MQSDRERGPGGAFRRPRTGREFHRQIGRTARQSVRRPFTASWPRVLHAGQALAGERELMTMKVGSARNVGSRLYGFLPRRLFLAAMAMMLLLPLGVTLWHPDFLLVQPVDEHRRPATFPAPSLLS